MSLEESPTKNRAEPKQAHAETLVTSKRTLIQDFKEDARPEARREDARPEWKHKRTLVQKAEMDAHPRQAEEDARPSQAEEDARPKSKRSGRSSGKGDARPVDEERTFAQKSWDARPEKRTLVHFQFIRMVRAGRDFLREARAQARNRGGAGCDISRVFNFSREPRARAGLTEGAGRDFY
ncbi:hypothetical protein LR48_Vigan03g157100 [Vigna angularis]|uniref:Uncharacterized protein n=1 Tax=Phaseolus angularis TaxID=3914 RepID=A0A0L9U6W7_PHAAN|nr:hypothetical protein LR48_Vigan03g157100 [Vigna angularis]